MKKEELRAFLASHKVKRFIDYLNPMGISATEAFQRRMVWARMMVADDVHRDEATFLLPAIVEVVKGLAARFAVLVQVVTAPCSHAHELLGAKGKLEGDVCAWFRL